MATLKDPKRVLEWGEPKIQPYYPVVLRRSTLYFSTGERAVYDSIEVANFYQPHWRLKGFYVNYHNPPTYPESLIPGTADITIISTNGSAVYLPQMIYYGQAMYSQEWWSEEPPQWLRLYV